MIRGTLDQLHLGDLLQWLQMGSLTGRLTLTRGHQVRHLDFCNGRVVFASSQVPDERLATWLAAEKTMPVEELRSLLGRSLLRRTLFTDLVLSTDAISAEDLGRSITRLAETMMARLLLTRKLDFVFDPAYPILDLLNLDLNVEAHSLLMEAARQSDESETIADGEDLDFLPASGEAFERLFWKLIRHGVSTASAVDGQQMEELHQTVGDILGTLEHWASSSPGLVPLPPRQREAIRAARRQGERVDMTGMPQACWNMMVLACAIRNSSLRLPRTLSELLDTAEALDLWDDMIEEEAWQRPDAGRLDALSHEVSSLWARAAVGAAPSLGVKSGAAALAAHLLTMPTDLVLWVLTNLSVNHSELRKTLVSELPRRLGTSLARVANFSVEFRNLFDCHNATALGVCMHVSRLVLPSAEVWPKTLPADESKVAAVASNHTLQLAAVEARKALND